MLIKQNLPGGTSAVVPPDPMPNSEVKRRSADGSVGSPHARVGNCQASNKAESPVERPGFLFLRLKRTPSRKVRGFLLCGVYLPRWRCAYRGYKTVPRTKCAAPPPAKITPCSLHYLLSTQNKTPSWQSLRHNPLFPCPCAGDDRENRVCEKKCESNHI